MKKEIYKIGMYKSGNQFAKEVFASENLEEVETEFKRMWESTDFCPEGTDNEAGNAEQAWELKHFSEDVNHVAVFKCNNEDDVCATTYIYTGGISNQM